MVIYLAFFALSLCFIYFYEKTQIKFFMLIGIAFPVILAALRSDVVGTDVRVYAEQLFDMAVSSNSFNDFTRMHWYSVWRYKTVSEFEIGYVILVYVCAKLHSFALLLGLTQFLTLYPISMVLDKYKKRYSGIMTIGLSIYYLLFYNMSLNMMRQWIAMAMMLLAFQYFKDGSNKYFIITFIIAILFHKAAILGLFIIMAYKFLNKKSGAVVLKTVQNTYDLKKILLLCLILIIFLLTISNKFRLSLINAFHFSEYATYIDGEVTLSLNQLVVDIPIIFLLISIWKFRKNIVDNYFYVFCIFSNIFLSQLASVMAYSSRISLYISIFKILIVPVYISSMSSKLQKYISLLGVIMFYLLYWYYTYVIKGIDATVPYVFTSFK